MALGKGFVLLLLFCSSSRAAIYDILRERGVESYALPELPYGYGDLEPYIDSRTLTVHHQGHHKSYTEKTNTALKSWRESKEASELAQASIVDILRYLSDVPEEWRTALRNSGGGFLNHILYWATMCPSPSSVAPTLLDDLTNTFGGLDEFEEQFTRVAKSLFGSGYVWLCEDANNDLVITTTQNQDCPLTNGLFPILVLDVWEHAYYLKHQYRRPDYISDWWKVVCWEEVQRLREFWHQANFTKDPHCEL